MASMRDDYDFNGVEETENTTNQEEGGSSGGYYFESGSGIVYGAHGNSTRLGVEDPILELGGQLEGTVLNKKANGSLWDSSPYFGLTGEVKSNSLNSYGDLMTNRNSGETRNWMNQPLSGGGGVADMIRNGSATRDVEGSFSDSGGRLEGIRLPSACAPQSASNGDVSLYLSSMSNGYMGNDNSGQIHRWPNESSGGVDGNRNFFSASQSSVSSLQPEPMNSRNAGLRGMSSSGASQGGAGLSTPMSGYPSIQPMQLQNDIEERLTPTVRHSSISRVGSVYSPRYPLQIGSPHSGGVHSDSLPSRSSPSYRALLATHDNNISTGHAQSNLSGNSYMGAAMSCLSLYEPMQNEANDDHFRTNLNGHLLENVVGPRFASPRSLHSDRTQGVGFAGNDDSVYLSSQCFPGVVDRRQYKGELGGRVQGQHSSTRNLSNNWDAYFLSLLAKPSVQYGPSSSRRSFALNRGSRGHPMPSPENFSSYDVRMFGIPLIVQNIVTMSTDQYGSRLVQQKLASASPEDKEKLFRAIYPHAMTLMTDVSGNYVIQKIFVHGTEAQRRQLITLLDGNVLSLSLQIYGCRVVQKALETGDLEQQKQIISELQGYVLNCVHHQNGNHVIQKCAECVPQDHIQFILSALHGEFVSLSMHPYGCRVVQRILECCNREETQNAIISELLPSACDLAFDHYGNYVIQHVLQIRNQAGPSAFIGELLGQVVEMSQHRHASNVVEKCLIYGTPQEKHLIIQKLLGSAEEKDTLEVLMKDPYGNYVLQKALDACDGRNRQQFLERIRQHINKLRIHKFAKCLISRVETMLQQRGA